MDAILLAAGKGTRINAENPKQFIKIAGKPMFIYSLEALRKSKYIDTIYLTCNPLHLNLYKEILTNYAIERVVLVEGGDSRQQSVYKALLEAKSNRIIIHEGARPLISTDFIEEIISQDQQDGVIPTMPISFSIIEGEQFIEKELVRSRLHNIQLPQLFDREKLLNAHKKAIKDDYQTTEDGMLLFHYGGKVKLVKGRESNIKVTTPLDIEIVEKLIKLG